MSIKDKTIAWWDKCLQDPIKLEGWLISLYNNEKDAEYRFIEFANKYCTENKEAYDVFIEIAQQEHDHAILVEKVIEVRGITLYEKSSKDGRYWQKTLACVKDMNTAASVGAYAESLSLGRMRVIMAHEGTPQDLKDMFAVIEPDEAYHARILTEIGGKFGMKEVKECHDDGLEALGLKIKSSND